MISQIFMIFTLISIWISLAWGLVILFSAVHFWFKHSDFRVDTTYSETKTFFKKKQTLLGLAF